MILEIGRLYNLWWTFFKASMKASLMMQFSPICLLLSVCTFAKCSRIICNPTSTGTSSLLILPLRMHSRSLRHLGFSKSSSFPIDPLTDGFGTAFNLWNNFHKFAAYVNSADHPPPPSPRLPSSSSSAAYLVAELTGAQGERRVNTRENTYIGKYFPLLSF